MDEDEIMSPFLEDDGYAIWPWEKWFRKKKKKKVMSDDNLYVLSSNKYKFEDLDVSTPKWQRYYDKASNKIEGYAEKIKDRANRSDDKNSVACQTDEFVGWIPCEGGADEATLIRTTSEPKSGKQGIFGAFNGKKDKDKSKRGKKKKKKKKDGIGLVDDEALEEPDQLPPPPNHRHQGTSIDTDLSEETQIPATTIVPTAELTPEHLNLPPISSWPAHPVYARFNQNVHHGGKGLGGATIPINIRGDSGFVEFETDLFKGKLSLSIADLENSEMQSIFDGRKVRNREERSDELRMC